MIQKNRVISVFILWFTFFFKEL